MAFGARIQENQQERQIKSMWLAGAVCLFFVILFGRLIFIQIFQAESSLRLSQENSMHLHVLKAPRGRILDRNGLVLASNRPSYSICVLPHKLKNSKQVISNLCKIRDSLDQPVFDSTELATIFSKARFRRFDLTRLEEDVSIELVSIIEEHSMDLPGIIVETESRREYPYGPACFHVLGYMGEIPETHFDSLKLQGYAYGDQLGKAGLEREYETLFRGTSGQEYVEVNAHGKLLGPIPNMPSKPAVAGVDAYVSLDARLQQKAFEVFPDSLRGAIVAIDPRNGEVLLMFSSPTVDPNIFSLATTLRSKSWAKIATDPALPLNNRAVSGTYTPGSTFKLVSSLAALESGKISIHSHMSKSCSGAYRIGRRVAHCWLLSGHGSLDLNGAVRQSCNVFFFQTGLMLGDKYINKYATMLGLGEATGIDLPHEKNGYLSGEEAHNRRFAKKILHGEGWQWTAGLQADLAIGQVQVLTPIQLARMVGTLAQGQALYRPHLIKELRNQSGAVTMQHQPELVNRLEVKPEHIQQLREAMWQVTQPGGTAGRSRVEGIRVGGKTGSAENPHGDQTHSLFVGAAPIDNPEIAIAVVAENAGHGSSVAAPIAGEILRFYFSEVAPRPDTTKTSTQAEPTDQP